jgi:hypothetical protein
VRLLLSLVGEERNMSLIGLDLNATRARAMHGESQRGVSRVPAALPLDGNARDLPVALSLEERPPLVGRAGAVLCRKSPHLACVDFLPRLGDSQTWGTGRHRLDAARALGLVFEQLQNCFCRAEAVSIALPAYLTPAQAGLVANLAGKARWRLLGSIPTPIAATLAAHDYLPWTGLALILDVDGHALTLSAVSVSDDVARLVQVFAAKHLARDAWLCRLIDSAAHRCVRLSRRDPRESAETEQALYDQLAGTLQTCNGSEPAHLVLQTPHWYQHLTFQPAELSAFCAPLVQQAVIEVQHVLASIGSIGPVGALLLTASAARLPGLTAALDELLLAPEGATGDPRLPSALNDEADFGDSLIPDADQMSTRVHVLDDDAVARATYDLAVRQHHGQMPRGHLDAVPLPGASDARVDRGPVRLSFRGEEHLLSGTTFTLGRDPNCNLVFASEIFPTVSGRHCEIVFDGRAYLLLDRSRHGTLVNDTPVSQPVVLHSGDWIRLGPAGPLIRFLGHPSDRRHLMTIA